MSAFKEAVALDVGQVFLNKDEFADIHELGEERAPLLCVIDRDLTGQLGSDFSGHVGLFEETLTVYVKSKEFPNPPVEGQAFRIDGGYHIVRSVSDEDGVLVIVCAASEQ